MMTVQSAVVDSGKNSVDSCSSSLVEAGVDSGAGVCGDVAVLVEMASERGRLIRTAMIRRRIEAKKSRELAKTKVCEEVLL